ncbi:NB-ARC domain-containing protein [Favolaschia claudopus]|uniref:NB-ARC domain-containing protein n=1 Tax=Favolaschia claudopus TaxID=2862362 RepID=A0AAW0D1G9_9AGAR
MPPPPPPSHADNILKFAESAASTLSDISASSSVPFLRTIGAVSLSILSMVQTVKFNHAECLRMVAKVEELLSVILCLCAQQPEHELSHATLNNIGYFADTLNRIHVYVALQQNTSIFKRLFRQTESLRLLAECQAGLTQASELFRIETRLLTIAELMDMYSQAEKRHLELMEIYGPGGQSTDIGSDTTSLIDKSVFEFRNSTTSLIMVPANPKIFHGRDKELTAIVQLLLQDSPRVAILGPGGIGKTSLATAALHHPDISAKYTHRYFVSCESANNHNSLIAHIASHVGVSLNTSKQILGHFSASEPCILLLDNFETAWEPLVSRAQVEELLSLLADIPHLALMVTMRGAERPGSVLWTRPFLPPLHPLTDKAAQLVFLDITDQAPENDVEIFELLKLTDNIPLAITLIAHISVFEGYDTLLSRWRTENTSLLSEGSDKHSNLDLSIRLSLSSPRMLNSPGALQLLSVLSLLPDGILEADLQQIDLPIVELGRSKTTLIRTSLAYLDHDRHLRVLVPIREYIRLHNPPPPPMCRPLRRHFHQLVMLWNDYQHLSTVGIVHRLAANVGNFESVLKHGLRYDEPDLAETLRSAITFDSFCHISRRRPSGILPLLPEYLDKLGDHQLYGAYFSQLVRSWHHGVPFDSESLETTAVHHFRAANDLRGQSVFLSGLAHYFLNHDNNIDDALKYYTKARILAEEGGDTKSQCFALRGAAQSMVQLGQYREAQMISQELRCLAKLHGFFHEEVQAIRVEINCRVSLGDLKPCLSLCAEAQALLTFCGMQDTNLDLVLLGSLGNVHLQKTEFAEAKTLYSRTSSVKQAPLVDAYDRLNLTIIDNETGEATGQVQQQLDGIKAVFESIRHPTGMTFCEVLSASVHIRDGLPDKARLALEKALVETRGNNQEITVLCLTMLGDVSYGLNDTWTTYGWSLVLLGFARKDKSMIAAHHALRCMGDYFVAEGDDDTAQSLFQVALDGFTVMDIHRSRGWCAVRLGDLFHRRGKEEVALELWTIARSCFVRSQQEKDIELVDKRIVGAAKVAQSTK